MNRSIQWCLLPLIAAALTLRALPALAGGWGQSSLGSPGGSCATTPVAVSAPAEVKRDTLKLLDEKQGFVLRLVDERFTGTGEASYSLVLTKMEDGRQAVDVFVEAQALSHAAIELAFPEQQFSVAEGEYGEWPDSSQKLSRKLELDKPGVLRYKAQLASQTAVGASGKFRLLRVVLAQRQAWLP